MNADSVMGLLSVLVLLGQDGSTSTPSQVILPDGTVVERELRSGADGLEVSHGVCKVVSADDKVLLRGKFADGLRRSKWSFNYPNGEPRVRGSYRDGRRSGQWEFFYPDESQRAEGRYSDGQRNGEWVIREPNGARNDLESGNYEHVEGRLRESGRRYEGTLLDGRVHGAWTFHWPDGRKMLEAEFLRGRRAGHWRFWHPDGTHDREMLTGVYPARADWADLDGGPLLRDEVRKALGEYGGEAESAGEQPRVALDELPDLEHAPRVTPEEQLALERFFREFLSDAGVGDRPQPARQSFDLALMPLWVNALKQLDFASEANNEKAKKIAAWGWSLFRGKELRWREGTAPDDVAANQLSTLRYYSFYLLTRDQQEYWQMGMYADPGSIEVNGWLKRAPFDGEFVGTPAEEMSAVYAGRFADDRDLRRRGGAGTESHLENALEWLALHQSRNGSWDGDGFDVHCKKSICDGMANPNFDVGVTSLALLAFLADGHTTRHGRHQDVVRRGVGWLLEHTDPSGLVGEKQHWTFLNQHAVATQVLCEAATFSHVRAMGESAQRAVTYCLKARNPYGAWKYESPPQGENDSQVTAWMIAALIAAERAGLDIDREAFVGGLSWYDEVTDPATGWVPYDSKRVTSRYLHLNDNYPTDVPTLTAAGLWCRFLVGQNPETHPVMEQHANLIMLTPPAWEPDRLRCDMLYWYFGSEAMRRMGGQYHKKWNVGLTSALLVSQRVDGCAKGSWDPVGPWGMFGGRVYSTAMLALCLTSYYRYEDPSPAREASAGRKKRGR